MTRYVSSKKWVGFSILATLLFFAFSGSHPTTGSGGYTGAPNDNVCTTCHTPGGSLDGTIDISGLPGTVMPNTTYPLTVTITNTAGSAVRAGFQMVSLKQNLANGGTFSVPATESNAQVKNAAGKSYVGHQPAKNFSANQVIFNVEWTAPASATGAITLYGASMIANGANGNGGDKFVATNLSVTLGGSSDPLTGTFSNIIDATCTDSNDGSATINATGGSGNYMYTWDNGETNATAVMLSSGQHNVTVTDDSNEQIIETVTIGSPPPLFTTVIFQSDAVCNAGATGIAELNTTGGTPGYVYNWGNGITGATQNNLNAGIYNVTVSDLNDCTTIINVIINEPPPIQINIILLDQPSCNGDANGTISVEATGGNGDFTYNWLDGIGNPIQGTLSFIPAGDYQLEVIDGEDCATQTNITLGEPDAVIATAIGTDVLCFGDNTGTATAAGDGGSGGFTFSWSNGQIGPMQSGLAAGTYMVTVSDSEECSSVSSIEIFQPASAVEAGISIIDQPNCGNQDGTLSAFAIGGTPGYTYLWNTNSTDVTLTNIGSGIYAVTITDLNNCTSESTISLEDNDGVTLAANDVQNNTCFGDAEGSATISASGGSGTYTYSWSNGGSNAIENDLVAGMYTITVTDEGNCTGEITIEITEPNAFQANGILEDITCNGAENGSIQLNATGGTGDLTYLWNTGDVGDGIADLIPGIFSVTVTDANNCTGEIEFVIAEPDPIITGDIVSTTPSCPEEMDGMISLDPSGGTGTLTYNWSNGDTSNTISGIVAGDYTLSITDENDCEVIFDFTLDDAIPLSISSNIVSPTCSNSEDGSAAIAVTGGTGIYMVAWSNGDTTLTVENIAGGTYNVTVTDGNGCTEEAEILIVSPPAIEPNITSSDESTNGENDGSASANPMEGIAPYTYLWSTGDTTQIIENLAPGSYQLTITDANNCMVETNVIINSGDCEISTLVNFQDISCFGLTDGSISINLEGAVDPVSYLWNNGATTSSITDLSTGSYGVTITDANNCQVQLTEIGILEPDEIVASDVIILDASSASSMNGAIEIEFSGGTGDLTIEYTDGEGSSIGITSFENLMPGAYGAIVIDENGCEQFFGPYTIGVLSSNEDVNLIVANVYPNPARSFLVVDTDSKLSTSPYLFSVSGQVVETTMERSPYKYTFDTRSVPNGVYFIKLVSESEIVLKKIVIAH